MELVIVSYNLQKVSILKGVIKKISKTIICVNVLQLSFAQPLQ